MLIRTDGRPGEGVSRAVRETEGRRDGGDGGGMRAVGKGDVKGRSKDNQVSGGKGQGGRSRERARATDNSNAVCILCSPSASVKGQALTPWLCPTDVSVRGQATGGNRRHTHTHLDARSRTGGSAEITAPPHPHPSLPQKPRSAVLFIGCV